MATNTIIVTINGKQRKGFMRYGKVFVRTFIDIEAEEMDYFAKKADYLTTPDTDIIRKFIRAFNISFGLPRQENVKDAGCLFERRAQKFIEDATLKTIGEVSGCEISTS